MKAANETASLHEERIGPEEGCDEPGEMVSPNVDL
jgi:hypothetical protein